MYKRSKWCLIFIPDQQGVLNLGGRVGTARGPEVFRQVFDRLKSRDSVQETLGIRESVAPLSLNVEENLTTASQVIRKLHTHFGRSVVVGGGHDHGFSHLRGVAQALGPKGGKLGCINIDAHLDLRKPEPLIMSGSPFYLALESGTITPSRLVEFGIQRHCNGPELWKYAEEKKITTIPFEKLRHGKAVPLFKSVLRKLSAKSDAIVVSFDLDAVAEAYAPGVSAPQTEGFQPSEILEMMTIAGRDPKVVSLGVFELNPEHDLGMRTARLAATAVHHFIASKNGDI